MPLRRVESASGAEDASSFYKRLGLDILTPSSTSGLSQQVQSHQRDNQTNSARTSYTSQHAGSESVVTSLSQNVRTGRPVGGYQSTHRHGHGSNHAQHSNYGHWKQSNHANGLQSYHAHGNMSTHARGHQPRQSHGHQSYLHGHQSTHSSENQAHRAQTKTDFVNDGAFCWSRRDPLQIQDQSQPRFDRPVRKEPKVKPIDKYAPPDYLTIMYHPTPTLEDLGLTSYLDSPPSSPRAMSPVRDPEQIVTAATTEITIPDQDVKPAVHLEVSHVVDPRLLFGRRSRGQLTKREDSVCVGQSHSQLANREGSVCDTRHALAALQSTAHQSLESQSSALTRPNEAKRKGQGPNVAEGPKKKLCVWSTVAEQYVTETRQSDNQEARRDAAYRRYSSDGRPRMRQQSYDAERHQANIKYQTQPAGEESYDEMLAHQKARHNERHQYLKPDYQSLKQTNSVSYTLNTNSDKMTFGNTAHLYIAHSLRPIVPLYTNKSCPLYASTHCPVCAVNNESLRLSNLGSQKLPWSISDQVDKLDNRYVLATNSFSKDVIGQYNFYVSDIISPKIPMSLEFRCLHYSHLVLGDNALVVAYITDYFEPYEISHYLKTHGESSFINFSRTSVTLPIGTDFKLVFRAIQENWRGLILIDYISITDGLCEVCAENEFGCDDFRDECIPLSKVCDLNADCLGGEDEKNCDSEAVETVCKETMRTSHNKTQTLDEDSASNDADLNLSFSDSNGCFLTFRGIDVGSQEYAWFVVVLLPVKSALNPLIYMLSETLKWITRKPQRNGSTNKLKAA
uniref:MAM domain-containing protein n=1 Tax=Magallana gigas TaxID=29159 RepID=K1P895_MAGGI